jgi:predicted acyltransferase
MNLTIARSIPVTRRLLTPAYSVLSIGLALALCAAVVSETGASLSSSRGPAAPSGLTNPPLVQPAKQPVALYMSRARRRRTPSTVRSQRKGSQDQSM